ncbi:MAG: aspartate carbamoyltransferase catalytic subunit [Deltaproteobacteria bacterium]|nr:MAG: aspartate carbamoyltransferase catalytic subunit [Deltaproteobacteria bacterium]
MGFYAVGRGPLDAARAAVDGPLPAVPSSPPDVGSGPARRPGKDLLGIEGARAADLLAVLRRAARLLPVVEGPPPRRLRWLEGYTVVNFFGEPSTRTRSSFTLAAQRLGADVLDFVASDHTSVAKGETIVDAARNLDAMAVDAFVVRNREERLPHRLAELLRARIVNAGDGCNEHPTQALLDVWTIMEALGRPLEAPQPLAGTVVVVCGDIDHGRVAHSDILALRLLGAEVRAAGPVALFSDATAERLGVRPHRDFDAALDGAHAVVMLRIQRERLRADLEIDDASYHAAWGLSSDRLSRAGRDCVVLHPGPINRGIELSDTVADGPASRILRQVTLGVAVRMAVLLDACGVPTEGVSP